MAGSSEFLAGALGAPRADPEKQARAPSVQDGPRHVLTGPSAEYFRKQQGIEGKRKQKKAKEGQNATKANRRGNRRQQKTREGKRQEKATEDTRGQQKLADENRRLQKTKEG